MGSNRFAENTLRVAPLPDPSNTSVVPTGLPFWMSGKVRQYGLPERTARPPPLTRDPAPGGGLWRLRHGLGAMVLHLRAILGAASDARPGRPCFDPDEPRIAV